MCSSPVETAGALFAKSPSLLAAKSALTAVLFCLFMHGIENEQHSQKKKYWEQYWNYTAQLELCNTIRIMFIFHSRVYRTIEQDQINDMWAGTWGKWIFHFVDLKLSLLGQITSLPCTNKRYAIQTSQSNMWTWSNVMKLFVTQLNIFQ